MFNCVSSNFGGAKGTTVAADVTSAIVDANTQALHTNVTNFPATQDVLNEKNVHFVSPDNEVALADGIKYLVDHPEYAERLSAQAMLDIKPLSFDSKTNELLSWIKKLPL